MVGAPTLPVPRAIFRALFRFFIYIDFIGKTDVEPTATGHDRKGVVDPESHASAVWHEPQETERAT